jgi:hypothetical protein
MAFLVTKKKEILAASPQKLLWSPKINLFPVVRIGWTFSLTILIGISAPKPFTFYSN